MYREERSNHESCMCASFYILIYNVVVHSLAKYLIVVMHVTVVLSKVSAC